MDLLSGSSYFQPKRNQAGDHRGNQGHHRASAFWGLGRCLRLHVLVGPVQPWKASDDPSDLHLHETGYGSELAQAIYPHMPVLDWRKGDGGRKLVPARTQGRTKLSVRFLGAHRKRASDNW